MQQPQVIILNKRKCATGLFWQPVGAGHTPRTYAHILDKKINERLTLYTSDKSMIGLGGRKFGHRLGMQALAAEVMESFAEYSSFLAAFKVNNGIWIVAARNGIIVEDKLHYDETIAKASFEELFTITDWAALIAPGAWQKLRAIETKLEDVVIKEYKFDLKSVSHFSSNFLTIILFVLFVFSLVQFFKGPIEKITGSSYKASVVNTQLAEEYKRNLDKKLMPADTQTKLAEAKTVRLIMPYEKLPDVWNQTKLCWQAIGFLMQQIPGWNQTEAECSGNIATATLRRDFGTLDDFYAVGDRTMPGVAAEEISDSEIKLIVNLPEMTTGFKQPETDVAFVKREINSIFQRADMDADVSEDSDVISEGDQSADVNFVFVSADSKLEPKEFMRVFSEFSSVSIKSIRWDNNKNEWNYEVKVYVK